MDSAFEVFISYRHYDATRARTRAENPEPVGIRAFFEPWEIGPGEVLVHPLEERLRHLRTGILVAGAASVGPARPEPAGLMVRPPRTGVRLIRALAAVARIAFDQTMRSMCRKRR